VLPDTHKAVIRVYDDAGNVIEADGRAGSVNSLNTRNVGSPLMQLIFEVAGTWHFQ